MNLQVIQNEIANLQPNALEKFNEWYKEFTANKFEDDDWDKQMKADAEAGKLDFLAQKASQSLRDGECREL